MVPGSSWEEGWVRTLVGYTWSACCSFLLLELVLVVELSYTTCDAYGGDPSLAIGVTLNAVTHLP